MDREEVGKLLSEYVLGQLDADRAAAVQQHLARDEDLRRTEQTLRWLLPRLRDMKDHLPGQHPTGEELVALVTGFGEIANRREDWVRDHLGTCPECRLLADMIAETEREGQDEDAGRERTASAATPPRQWTKLAVAAVIALVLISTGLWFGQRNGNLAPTEEAHTVHLAGITRGQTGTADVSPSADGRLPILVLECDPWVGRATADDFLLEIRLMERETRQVITIWKVNAQSAWSADEQAVVLDPDSQAPPPGYYDLEVRDDRGQVIFQTGFHLLPR